MRAARAIPTAWGSLGERYHVSMPNILDYLSGLEGQIDLAAFYKRGARAKTRAPG